RLVELRREQHAREQEQVLGPLLRTQRLDERLDHRRLLPARLPFGSEVPRRIGVTFAEVPRRMRDGTLPMPAGAPAGPNSARSTSSHRACPMAMCPSWIRGVEKLGVISAKSHFAANLAPLAPVRPITTMPSRFAASTARSTLV